MSAFAYVVGLSSESGLPILSRKKGSCENVCNYDRNFG